MLLTIAQVNFLTKYMAVTGEGDAIEELPTTYPATLKQACLKAGRYTAQLSNKAVVAFTEAAPIDAEFVQLNVTKINGKPIEPTDFTNGVETRVRSIVWICEMPTPKTGDEVSDEAAE